MLKSSMQILYGRHHVLVDRYEINISQMTMDFCFIDSSITNKTFTGLENTFNKTGVLLETENTINKTGVLLETENTINKTAVLLETENTINKTGVLLENTINKTGVLLET